MSKGKRKVSAFQQHLNQSFKTKADKALTPEERKEKRYEKLQAIFEELGNKQNRYLFYCPDIPFANSMVKVIYEYAHILQNNGYNAVVMHEVKGFKPEWLKYDWAKDIKKEYLSEKKKDGRYSSPEYNFKPTDTIIVPDGFWQTMTGLYEMKTQHKVVLCMGYGGLTSIEPGVNWGTVGFTDVICMSEQVKKDYMEIWPHLNYHVIGYPLELEKLTPIEKTEQKPTIGMMSRSREDAQQIINLFYAKFPFLDMFQFKVLKKLDTEVYNECIRQCIVTVFIDEKAGYPAPPIESLAADIPVIAVYGRGMSHISKQEGVTWLPTGDNFLLTEQLAGFCIDWLEKVPETIKDKAILESFKEEKVIEKLLPVMEKFQEHKVKLFTAVKSAVDEGKLEENINV